MKYTIWVGILVSCISTTTWGQEDIPAVPEPGVVLYGKILASNGVTTIPATAINLQVRQVGGEDVSLSEPPNVINSDGVYYYIARIPFESVLPGLENTSIADLDGTDRSYQIQPDAVEYEGASDSSVTGVENAESSSAFDFGSNSLRGGVFRMDIQTQFDISNIADYDSWAVDHFGTTEGDGAKGADPDTDGLTNEQEWFFKTDPTNTNPDQRLHRTVINIHPVVEDPMHMTIKISPKWNDGRIYTVTKTTDLSDSDSWEVPTPPITIVDLAPIGDSGAVEAIATDTAANEEAAFYRIEVTLPSQTLDE